MATVAPDDIPELPALETTLEEIRERYQDEERRRNAVETKLSGLIALNGVLISIIGLPLGVALHWKVIAIGLFGLSATIAVYNLRGEQYQRPIKNERLYSILAQSAEKDAQRELLEQYITVITNNRQITDRRYQTLKRALGATLLGLILYFEGVVLSELPSLIAAL